MIHTNNYVEASMLDTNILAAENKRLRMAGTALSQAALRVVTEYDGLHRLALAVSEWAKVLADEHGRGEAKTPIEESKK